MNIIEEIRAFREIVLGKQDKIIPGGHIILGDDNVISVDFTPVNALIDRIEEVEDDINTLNFDTTILDIRIDAAEENIEDTQDHLDNVDNSINKLNENLDALETKVDNINGFEIVALSEGQYDPESMKPTIENPKTNTLYLVPNDDPTQRNLWIEWLWISNRWEQFGTAVIDLSEYVKKTDTPTATNPGVVKVNRPNGVQLLSNGQLSITAANLGDIQSGQDEYLPITPAQQHNAVFYGLARASRTPALYYNALDKTNIRLMIDAGSHAQVENLANDVEEFDIKVNQLSDTITDIQTDIYGDDFDKDISDFSSGIYYTVDSLTRKLKENINSGSRYAKFDVSNYIGKTVEITFDAVSSSSGRATGLCDKNDENVFPYIWEYNITNNRISFVIDKPILFVSFSSTPKSVSIHIDGDTRTGIFFTKEEGIALETYIDTSVSAISDDVKELRDKLIFEYVVPITLVTGKMITARSIGTDWTETISDNANSSYAQESAYIPTNLVGKKLKIYWDNHDNSSARSFGFCDANNKVITWYAEDRITYLSDENGVYFECDITSNYMFFSTKTSFGFKKAICRYSIIDKDDIAKETNAFVSKTGNDENNGTSVQSALATVTGAINKGFTKILVLGGTYLEKVDFTKAKGKNIEISAYERDKTPVFWDSSAIIGTSSVSVSGYTKISKFTKNKSIPSDLLWIYQDKISDESTIIPDSERHPLQRGKIYRCDDTKIVKCTATTLSEALTEIENSSEYKWFKDGNDWYLSSPSTISSNRPICASIGNSFLNNLDKSSSLKISGISVKYMQFNVSNTNNSIISDCKCSNVYGAGAFRYDNCLNIQFIRCEAERCQKGENGDGFNGHASGVSNDPFAKTVTCTMIDCWSHDNCDDGYSNHDRGEDTIIGGLYEYNGKAGVTPSFGTHCTCYNVYSRKNWCGFYCCGTVASTEGGKGTQMVCHNCVAEQNEGGGLISGFIVGNDGNSMLLVGCKSINNWNGFRAQTGASAKLIDCSAVGCHNILNDPDDAIVIKNTTLVSK